MKKSKLTKIIKEEIKSIIQENQPTTKPKEKETETLPDTAPKEPKRRKLGNPSVKPAPKMESVEEKDMIDKITQRFLKHKK